MAFFAKTLTNTFLPLLSVPSVLLMKCQTRVNAKLSQSKCQLVSLQSAFPDRNQGNFPNFSVVFINLLLTKRLLETIC